MAAACLADREFVSRVQHASLHPPDTGSESGARWYALQIRQRYEKPASEILKNKGYEEFLPMYRARRRWSDRIKEVDLPLFPGYLFCRFDLNAKRAPVVTTPGVTRIVAYGGIATPVDETEIAGIHKLLDSGCLAEPWPYMTQGDIVRIRHGALQGVEGTYIETKKGNRLVLSISLLQRSVAFEIDSASVTLVRRAA